MAATKLTRGVEGATGIYVYDRRKGDIPAHAIAEEHVKDYKSFLQEVRQVCQITTKDSYVLTTTSREKVDEKNFAQIELGDTLYILENVDQELAAQAEEKVNFLPHYDTIVKGGMYEYYASEGQNPLPYAFAELIDNALAATAENFGPRNIDIRLYLDDANPAKNMVVVTDNGCGMTSRQLNNWAIYRLSKFTRQNRRGKFLSDGESDGRSSPLLSNAPRSLNSDISYFGVGGKQAIFFIGSCTRMITKPRGYQDVHELVISKEAFEERERNHEAIYSGYIRNRKPGDGSHLSGDDDNLTGIIEEEKEKENFTTVVVTGISPEHIPYLKLHFKEWTRQLSHIYHYYIHGPNGNMQDMETDKDDGIQKIDLVPEDWFAKINMEVKLFTRNQPRMSVNLRDIEDDMQSLYIRSTASQFEFKATVEGLGRVEGVLRYHPFLYDRETYPSDANDPRAEPDPEDDHDYTVSDVRPARGRRSIFECYWNGRLIPYTSIEDFEWCSVPKKVRNIPADCFNRVSGVLFTNDKFQVSTNKLTFTDLEMKLKDKNTAYCRVSGKNEKRTDICKEFMGWLKECHTHCDKQVKFSLYKESITRHDLPKTRQGPWAIYEQIEWDGKEFKKGTMVRIQKTLPILYGTIKRFLLYGDYEGDVYATGGDVEVAQEPRSLYDDVRIVPLSKLDRLASINVVQRYLEDEETKLPDNLVVTWPEGCEVKDGEGRLAGSTIGALKVAIANKKGEHISKLPGSQQRKLLVELKIVWHGAHDEVVVHHISQHGKNWPYWFRKMENIKNLGSYTLQLQTVLNESGVHSFAGKELPSHQIKFNVTEADAEKFIVGMLEGPFRVGAPFEIPLEFQDEFGHPTSPNTKVKPILTANGIDISYKSLKMEGMMLVIKDIIASGSVSSVSGKSFSLVVKIPELRNDTQTLKIRLLPGSPHALSVSPEDNQTVENGMAATWQVSVTDEAGNPSCQSRLIVTCRFSGATGLPTYSVDCSNTGEGALTGPPLYISKLSQEKNITAKIEVQGVKDITSIERMVMLQPSHRVASMQVSYVTNGNKTDIQSGQDIVGAAGDSLKGLKFELTDEAGRTLEVDGNLAEKLKVNWTPKMNKEHILRGSLPDLKLPTSVLESKYCHISVSGSGVDFSFNVKSTPGEPHQMKCKCVGSNKTRMGETLAADIVATIMDKHGNDIKKFEKGVLKDLIVSGDGLVTEELVRALAQTSGFLLHNIRFESSSMGSRELEIEWRGLSDFVRLEIEAGLPDKINVPHWIMGENLTLFSDNKLPRPLIVQLCDKHGNPSSVENVRIQLSKDTGLRLVPAPQPMKTDKAGQVNFGQMTVSGKRGDYEMQPKAFMGRSTMIGPRLKITIEADSNKAVSLELQYDQSCQHIAGESLPDFTVKVTAEDEKLMVSAKAMHLHMKLWKADLIQTKPHGRTVSFSPDKDTNQNGSFYFSNHKVPEEAGTYNLMFVYNDNKHEVTTGVIALKVQPGPPVKLVPAQIPGTPTVSNGTNSNTRCLIRNLRFDLADKFGNPSGSELTGKLKISVTHREKDMNELPLFSGNASELSFTLTKGHATLQNIVIQENTAGRDGQEYVLHCKADCSNLKKSAIPAYEIPFLFYNDVKKQAQMAALTKERDNIVSVIRTYKNLFDTTRQLISELKLSLQEAQDEEQKLKAELRKMGIPAAHIPNPNAVSSLIEEKQRNREQIKNAPRRVCGLPPAANDPEVLGKISHLAQVKDHDIARVLSWHMSADMDCVVTLTTKKAKAIYGQSHGKQQVLPLDSIYRKNLPDWNKTLPHIKVRPGWKPPGNPVFARSQLNFPSNEDSCRIVFGMLLGDTIILDNLDDANAYRQELVKHTHCPTILTRDGDRIRSNGKFGGLMNKALPVEKLRGAIFSAPIDDSFHSLAAQITALQNIKGSMVRRQIAEEELAEQLRNQKTPEMKNKLGEFSEAELQLKDIEKRLGMTPTSGTTSQRRGHSRSNTADPLPSPALKKARPSPAATARATTPTSARATTPSASARATTPTSARATPTSSRATPPAAAAVNGTPVTPVRQSTRRAALNAPSWGEELKRRRKT